MTKLIKTLEFPFAIFAENCNFVEIAFVAPQFPLKFIQLHRFNPTPLNVFFYVHRLFPPSAFSFG